MSSRGVCLAVAALGLWGCDALEAALPAAQGGGALTVPGTYHFARMTPGHREHLALRGEQRVPCRSCHALADAGFAAPSAAICAGCHAEQQRQHHPLSIEGGDSMTCLSCHVFRAEGGAAGPGVRFEKWACMNCHGEAQGTKAPISVHLERCASCHRPHERPFTVAADCGSCHEVVLTHGAKGETVAQTCMACHPPHTKAPVASGQCLGCHVKPTLTSAARVSPQALFPEGHVGCGSCHTAHLFQKTAVRACASCHQNTLVLAPDSHTGCGSCHLPHQARAQPKPCEQCHREIASTNKHPPSKAGQRCTGCHVPHPAEPGPVAVACVSCHQEPVFSGDEVHASSLSCASCHPPHGGKPARQALCANCHESQVKAVKLNRGHADCGACHAGLPHAQNAAPKACLSCHEDKVPPQKKHPDCASCHASHSGAVTKTCSACHLTQGSPPLSGLHAVQEHRECASCHAPHTPEPPRGAATCRTCHQRLPPQSHPTPPVQCVGCHLFTKGK